MDVISFLLGLLSGTLIMFIGLVYLAVKWGDK